MDQDYFKSNHHRFTHEGNSFFPQNTATFSSKLKDKLNNTTKHFFN